MKKRPHVEEGYSAEEMRALTYKMIDESAERLRRSLRVAWKRQERSGRVRHGVTV